MKTKNFFSLEKMNETQASNWKKIIVKHKFYKPCIIYV